MCCLSHHKGSFQPSARLQLPSSRYSSPKLGPWKTSCPGCQHYSLLQQLTLAEATSSPSHALGFGVRRKLISNLPAYHLAGVDFIPIVVETLGGWCYFHHSLDRSCPRTTTKLHQHCGHDETPFWSSCYSPVARKRRSVDAPTSYPPSFH